MWTPYAGNARSQAQPEQGNELRRRRNGAQNAMNSRSGLQDCSPIEILWSRRDCFDLSSPAVRGQSLPFAASASALWGARSTQRRGAHGLCSSADWCMRGCGLHASIQKRIYGPPRQHSSTVVYDSGRIRLAQEQTFFDVPVPVQLTYRIVHTSQYGRAATPSTCLTQSGSPHGGLGAGVPRCYHAHLLGAMLAQCADETPSSIRGGRSMSSRVV